MNWRTNKPTEKVIVAKLTEDFCHLKDSYTILRLANEPYQHYCEDGEEIPYSAIEKWASLEENKLPEGLEEAARKAYPIKTDTLYDKYGNAEEVDINKKAREAFIAGAEYQRKQDQILIELGEDHAMLAGMNMMKEQMMGKAVEGVVQDNGQFINFGDGRYIDLDPSLQLNPVWKLNDGQKVKLIIIPEDENVD